MQYFICIYVYIYIYMILYIIYSMLYITGENRERMPQLIFYDPGRKVVAATQLNWVIRRCELAVALFGPGMSSEVGVQLQFLKFFMNITTIYHK